MSHQQTSARGDTNRNYIIFLVVAVLLIASFAWRIAIPAHEYPVRADQVLTMGTDLLLIVALVGMKRQLSQGKVLFWIALAAGIGLFLIRLTSDAAWWTGHLVYYIPVRSY